MLHLEEKTTSHQQPVFPLKETQSDISEGFNPYHRHVCCSTELHILTVKLIFSFDVPSGKNLTSAVGSDGNLSGTIIII